MNMKKRCASIPVTPKRITTSGMPCSRTSRASEAIQEYERALRIAPNSASAHNNLAAALGQLGRIPEAIEQLKAALRINPYYIDARNNLTKLQALQTPAPAKN